jgi:uncharacterized protein involved in exopolysaccharide biosynthesis
MYENAAKEVDKEEMKVLKEKLENMDNKLKEAENKVRLTQAILNVLISTRKRNSWNC